MFNIKYWLNMAKQHKLVVTNESTTDELSLCVNLLSIPNTHTIAVTVTFLKDQKKKNAAPPWNFAKVLGVLESILREIDDETAGCFQPVDVSFQWYHVLNCHRIFFITETSTPQFISLFLRKNRLEMIRSQGINEVCLIADTQQYKFNIKI